MTVRIRNSSRLIHANLKEYAGVEFWELPEYPAIEEREDDIFHDVDQADRIDLLAERYYSDAGFWWVIALANGIKMIPHDLVTGARIRIPSPDYVTTKLMKPGAR